MSGPEELFDARYRLLFEDVRRLIGRTRDWDSNVRGNWKIQYYECYYHLTLEEFRNQARDDWLQQFFQWTDRCLSRGFGLYLDY